MIAGMEKFVGRKLTETVVQQRGIKDSGGKGNYIITRPDFYRSSIHINMYIYFDEERRIIDFDGDKCFSVCRGLYNRSAAVHDREFTKRDIQYLRRYVKENSEE